MTIGQSVRKHRLLHHLTQKELADKLCITNRGVCYIENGQRQPCWDVLRKLIELFGIDLVVDAMVGDGGST